MQKVLRSIVAVYCMLLVAACNDTQVSSPGNSTAPVLRIGKDRVAQVRLPSNYTTKVRYPLILVLHGLGGDGDEIARYLGLDSRVDTRHFILVEPEGTRNARGLNFWNATPACCAASPEDLQVDDVAYIRGLIEAAVDNYSIDARRIGLIGFSNGGFMALRMACEASDLVTAVVSLAGSTFADSASCAPASKPVRVLALHGSADADIFYNGHEGGPATFPGAKETITRFAANAGCDTGKPLIAPNLDVVGNIAGAETSVLEYSGCSAGVDVALWTIVGAGHAPGPWNASALDAIVNWVTEHPRD